MVLFRLLGLSLFIFFCSASAVKQTGLAKEVCKKTSNYTFCVESLYTDPRAPKANRQTLAYITFGLAYLNASKTQKHIAELLEKHSHSRLLKRCKNDYNKAVSKLEGAYNDLNSETYFELADDANEASGYAKDCQAAINGASSLTPRNRHLKGLCEICVVVAKLFTGK